MRDAGGDAEVVLAAGADVQRLLDHLAEEHVAALGAAQPQAFGDALAAVLATGGGRGRTAGGGVRRVGNLRQFGS